MKKKSSLKKTVSSPNGSLILFVFPFLLLFMVFFFIPFLYGFFMSFTNSNGFTPAFDFVGIKNYVEMFLEDPKFYNSLGLTILFSLVSVVLGNVLAMILAFAIESGAKLKNMFRTMYFLPYVFALVIVGFTWKFIFTQFLPQAGNLLHLGILNQDWIGSPGLAIWSAIIMQIWYNIGYYLVIYIAGIQAVDTSMMEAARIDGAGTWNLYVKVMIPLLIPSITVCAFTGIASSFKAFDSILSLTGGGPGFATEVLALNIYYDSMGDAQRYGYGMAKAMVLALIIFVITMIQLKFFQKREVEA